ncbi:MAG: hypothetical protein ACLRFR_02490 [Clostridia bacterium]
MPAFLVWLGKAAIAVIGTAGGVAAGAAISNAASGGGSTTPAPAPEATTAAFDWQGLLISIAIAAGVALVTWLIIRRK